MSELMPDKIKFLFEDTKGSLQGLIVFFILKSNIKNDFMIGPLVTGNNGEIFLTRGLVEKKISITKNEFPMDYAGTLNDCEQLNILVETRVELDDRACRLAEFYPDEALELQKIIDKATNNEISLNKEISMPIENKEITIEL